MTQDSLKLSNQPQNHVNEKCSLCSESNQEAKGAIYLTVIFFFFLAMLCYGCFVQAVSGCGEWELLLVAVHGLLTEVVSFVAEHKLE